MTDGLAGEATYTVQTKDNPEDNPSFGTRNNTSRTKAKFEEAESKDLREIQDVVSRYVGQLLYGCSRLTCTESLCDTGRRNTSKRPVRKYTPRSARAIALTLASGPKPRSRLCPNFVPNSLSSYPTIPEGPRDPTSSLQQLCDSTTILNICDLSKVRDKGECVLRSRNAISQPHESSSAFRFWHAEMRHLSKSFYKSSNATPDEILNDNDVASYHLGDCLQWLLDKLPQDNAYHWRRVNGIIGAGCAYPANYGNVLPEPWHNTCLTLLDGLENGSSCELLCQLLKVVAERDTDTKSACKDRDRMVCDRKCLASKLAARVLSGRHLNERLDLIIWLKKIFLQYWDGDFYVADGTLASGSLNLLSHIFQEAVEGGLSLQLDQKILNIPVVAHRLDAIEFVRSYLAGRRYSHLLSLPFRFIFNIKQEIMYFRTMNHLRMQKANSEAEIASALRIRADRKSLETAVESQLKYLEERYLLLNVSRGNVLRDAFAQLWQRRTGELLRPMRVRLGEMDTFEVGHDLGGVQIEFFNLFCKEIFNETAQMFTTDPTSGYSYFCPGSLQPLYMFELCGLLFALAIYNGISLPVNLPSAFYVVLMHNRDDRLDSIGDGWPVVQRSLHYVLDQDVPGIDNTFPLETNGLRLTVIPNEEPISNVSSRITLNVVDATPIRHHEYGNHGGHVANEQGQSRSKDGHPAIDISSIADAWPGWHLVKASQEPTELTRANVRDYVTNYVRWVTFGSVEPQWRAFRKGFQYVLDDLSVISSKNLKLIVEGSTDLDVNELRRVTTYDGYEPTSKYIQNFWRLVFNWPEEKQKQLLKFVTACERIPATGISSLTFKIQRATPMSLDHLPTSSTCFGTLILPKYASVEVLDKKLSLALKYGVEGFGSG